MTLWTLAAALAAPPSDIDTAAPKAPMQAVHDPAHPMALGTRIGAWTGPYSSPALGGHIKLKPTRALGFEGFMDHTLRLADGIARHDHIIGFSIYTPLLVGAERWFLSPTGGACVDFRVDTPFRERGPSNSDILFGVHGGAMVELAVGRGWSLETNAQAYVYWGNAIATDAWSASASTGLHPTAVLHLAGSINYTL